MEPWRRSGGIEVNSNKVHFVIDLAIHEGKFDDFAATLKRMTDGTTREPGALAYEWYLSDDHSRCRLLETYANADAMKQHLAGPVVQELVPKLLTFSTIKRFEVFGTPDAQSAAALTSMGAQIFGHWHGLVSQQSSALNRV
jgi:quinol monooxygenase YgiN